MRHAISAPGVAAAVAVLWLGAACGGANHLQEAKAHIEEDAAYRIAHIEGEAPTEWCADFDHPQFARLTEQTFEDNLELQAAWARLEQSEAVARQQAAGLWPWLDAQGGVTHQKIDLSTTFGEGITGQGGGEDGQEAPGQEGDGGALPSSTTFTTYQTSVAASYEIDVWGRVRSERDAARLDAMATRAQAESLAMTLMAQLAETWLEVLYQRERIDLLDEQVDVSSRYYELTLLRLRLGEATALDVTQQRQNLEELRGELALARGAEKTARTQLAVLVGRAPNEPIAVPPEKLPRIEPTPPAGVPADLLTRRPDVRAANLQLRAADHRIAAAHAERLPALSLSADLSFQANELAGLFEQLLWSVGGSIAQPIFQGGRLAAQADQAESAADEALFTYAQTLYEAIGEVQEALILEEQREAYLESLREQAEQARTALELARERFRRGASDYLRVLTAIEALQGVEQAVLDGRRQRLSTRIQLCRALGGTWTRRLERPVKRGARDEEAR
ncbi:MAG: efflux transporter outer membrane subunit [Persicimonas sp.]